MFTVLSIAFTQPIKNILKEVFQSGSAKGEIWMERKTVRNEESVKAGSQHRLAKRARTKKF